MAFELIFSKEFKKHYKKLSLNEKKQVTKKLDFLVSDPSHPSLRTKRIKSTSNLWESSINMDIRILWFYEGDKIIFLVDVGHHDILKRF